MNGYDCDVIAVVERDLAGGRIVPRAPQSRCAINCPEPAATAAPPVPVTGGLS